MTRCNVFKAVGRRIIILWAIRMIFIRNACLSKYYVKIWLYGYIFSLSFANPPPLLLNFRTHFVLNVLFSLYATEAALVSYELTVC